MTVATTDELNRIFIFRSQFVRLLKASQSFLVSVEKVKCIPFPKVPISISGFFLLDGDKLVGLIQENKIEEIVLGQPKEDMDGTVGPSRRKVREF